MVVQSMEHDENAYWKRHHYHHGWSQSICTRTSIQKNSQNHQKSISKRHDQRLFCWFSCTKNLITLAWLLDLGPASWRSNKQLVSIAQKSEPWPLGSGNFCWAYICWAYICWAYICWAYMLSIYEAFKCNRREEHQKIIPLRGKLCYNVINPVAIWFMNQHL